MTLVAHLITAILFHASTPFFLMATARGSAYLWPPEHVREELSWQVAPSAAVPRQGIKGRGWWQWARRVSSAVAFAIRIRSSSLRLRDLLAIRQGV